MTDQFERSVIVNDKPVRASLAQRREPCGPLRALRKGIRSRKERYVSAKLAKDRKARGVGAVSKEGRPYKCRFTRSSAPAIQRQARVSGRLPFRKPPTRLFDFRLESLRLIAE